MQTVETEKCSAIPEFIVIKYAEFFIVCKFLKAYFMPINSEIPRIYSFWREGL
jgi:hypothetical protein